MTAAPRWSYVQARLQARHGERLQEVDWRALEAARSLDQYIERSRASALLRFAERLNAGMSSHAIERMLRVAWRDYVAEVASWNAVEWRPAILWCAVLPDLPAIDALLRGQEPLWARQDPGLAEFLERERVPLDKSASAALLPRTRSAPTLAQRWYAKWRSLWPHDSTCDSLARFAETVEAHCARLDRADPQETSAVYRRDLAQQIIRIFRRHRGSPIAVFCHLALVALDLERLRGGLVRRALFAPAKEAA